MQSIFSPAARREKLREHENAQRRDGELKMEMQSIFSPDFSQAGYPASAKHRNWAWLGPGPLWRTRRSRFRGPGRVIAASFGIFGQIPPQRGQGCPCASNT